MAVNTKLRLSNAKFEQLSATTLTLSGNTVVGATGSICYATHPTSFENTELVDKKYVDDSTGAIGGANGLGIDGNNIVLGGNLTGATDICTCSNTLNIYGQNATSAFNYTTGSWNIIENVGVLKSSGIFQVADINLCAQDCSTNWCYGQLSLQDDQAQLQFVTTGTSKSLLLQEADATFTDADQIGLCYGGDYEDNFVPRSLVTCKFVDSLTSGITGAFTTANNGLYSTGQEVHLGGALTGDTTINGDNNALTINALSTGQLTADGGMCVSSVSGNLTLAACAQSLVINGAGGATFTDSAVAPAGIQYADNYEDDFVALSLVTAQFVTGLTCQGITSAINGITLSSQQIELGGTTPLSKATNILGGGQALSLGTSGNKLAAFQINAASAAVLSDGAIDVCAGTGILTLDSTNSCVLVKAVAKYDNDCASEYDLRSLPDVHFVTGLTSQALNTANNGLYVTGDEVHLGGALTGDTTISGSHTLCLDSLTAFNATATNIGLIGIVCATGVVGMSSTLTVAGATSLAAVCASGAADLNSTLNVQGATSLQSTLNVTGATTLCGTLNLCSVGAGAGDDVLLVLDSTGAVQCITQTSLDVTAVNGLTATGNEVKLGGTLTGLTTIDGAETLCLSSLTAFNATATDIALIGTVAVSGALSTDSTVTMTNTAAGVVTNPIMVLDGGVVKCVPASSFDVTAANGLCADGNEVALGGTLCETTTITGSHLLAINVNTVHLTGATGGVNLGGTVYLKSTPSSGTGDVLTYNATTGAVEKTTLSSLGGVTGATNGLNDAGNQEIGLGGTLCDPTCIDGSQTLTFDLAEDITLRSTGDNSIELDSQDNGSVTLKSQSGSITNPLSFTNAVGILADFDASSGFAIYDNRANCTGIVYAEDYSNCYVDRSLVDKGYVDTVATGLNAKAAVHLTTTDSDGNINLASFSSGSTIDGHVVNDGDRILIKNQTDKTQNGIYVFSGSSDSFARSEDYDGAPTGEVANGDLIPVLTGDTYGSTQWIQTTPDPITVGSSDLEFSLFSQLLQISAGDGIKLEQSGGVKTASVRIPSGGTGGLEFSGSDLVVANEIAGSGLTYSTGVLTVNACADSATGTCIPVLFDASCNLVVDSDDFSYTCADNGLSKDGCNVVLGGALTGNTLICIIGSTELKFQDDRPTTVGLEYAGDYETDFGARSLVTAAYVTGVTCQGITTANNGLYSTGQEVHLGGALTGDTTISGSHTLCLDSLTAFNATATNIALTGIVAVSGAFSTDSTVTLSNTAAGAVTNPILVLDGGVVKCVTASSFDVTAVNGLSANSNEVKLGGTLTGLTTIDGAETLCLDSLTAFNATATNIALIGTVAVTGAMTASSTLGVTGAITGGNNLNISGATWLDSTLRVDDAVTLTTVAGGTTSNPIMVLDAGVIKCVAASSFDVTAVNGITATGNEVKLGTDLCEPTTIAGTTTDSLSLTQVNATDSAFIKFNGEGVIDLKVFSDTAFTDSETGIQIGCEIVEMKASDNVALQNICLDAAGAAMTVVDAISSKGFVYASDYEDNFTARSLVTAQYVTGLTSGITGAFTTANNGLYSTGQEVHLGGALTGDTTISGAHTLCLSSLTAFNATATNIALTGIVAVSGALSTDSTVTMTNTAAGAATNPILVLDGDVVKCVTASSFDVTAGNGLTATGNYVALGGTLTGNTCVDGVFDMTFDNTNIYLTAAVCVTGAMDTSSTLGVGSTLTLDTVGDGDVATDSVLLRNDTTGVVTKIAATALGEDNNNYVTSGVTSATTLDDTYYAVMANSTGGTFTVTLPSDPEVGQAYKIKDSGLDALTNNITVDGNTNLIDGQSTATINTDGGALEVMWDGTSWNVLSFVN